MKRQPTGEEIQRANKNTRLVIRETQMNTKMKCHIFFITLAEKKDW